MHKKFFLTLINILLTILWMQAQTSKTTNIESEEDIMAGSGGIRIYKYPAFTFGKVYSKDGDSSGGKMNLNYYRGTMDFIDSKGDTMSLNNEETIKKVIIVADTFLYDQGFLQLVKQNEKASLGLRKKIKVLDHQKIGAYGISTSTNNVESKDAIMENQTLKLKKNDKILLSEQYTYVISDTKTPFVDATRRNIIKLFYEKKESIANYLNTKKVDLNKEEELKALLDYLHMTK